MLAVAIASAFCSSAIWSYRRSVEIRNYTALSEEASIMSVHPISSNNKGRSTESRSSQASLEMVHIVDSDPMAPSTDGISADDSRIETQILQDELREPDVTYHRIVEG